jgi:hypothetical protein
MHSRVRLVVQCLTTRDESLGGNLERSLRSTHPAWADELRRMLESGSKAEIEAAYSCAAAGGGAAGFSGMLVDCLGRGDII